MLSWHLHVYNADSMNLPTLAWDLFLRFVFRSCICMGCGDAATLSNDNHLLLPVQNIPLLLYVDVISFLLAKLVASVFYWVACLSVWQIKWGWCKWLNMWLMWLVCLLCCWGGSGDIRACDSWPFFLIGTHANIKCIHPHKEAHTRWIPHECVFMIERDSSFLNHNFMHNVTDLDAAQPASTGSNPNSAFRLVYFWDASANHAPN